MQRYFSIFVILILFAFGGVSAQAHESDENIQAEAQKLLEVHGFKEIQVTSSAGILTLSGSVADHEQADNILSIISHVEGVKKINSNLVVTAEDADFESEIEAREDTIEMKQEDEIPVSGEMDEEESENRIQRTVRAGGRATERVDDDELAEDIEEKLADLGYADLKINVMAEDGIVFLSGSVEDPEDANQMLVELAQIDGVKEIRTNLTVLEDDETLEPEEAVEELEDEIED